MKIKITQYRPAFFSGFENEVHEVDTTEELLNIPFVKSFSDSPNFHRYSIADDHLMCELKNGYEWWVIGTITTNGWIVIDLPKWEEKYMDKN